MAAKMRQGQSIIVKNRMSLCPGGNMLRPGGLFAKRRADRKLGETEI